MPKLIIVFNPISGKGKGKRIVDALMAELRGFRCISVSGSSAQDCLANLRSQAEGATAIVAVGGDGLLNIAIQVAAESSIPLFLWACGTGNDFARVHFPLKPTIKALQKTLDELGTASVDLAQVTIGNTPRYFGQVLSMGFDSYVNARANNLSIIKNSFKYTLATLIEIWKFKPIKYEMMIDGRMRTFMAMMVVIANGPSYGGGMLIHPKAKPNDGYLDFLIVHPVSKFELLRVFPKIFSGRHIKHPKIEFGRAEYFKLSGLAPIYADGEYFGSNECEIKVKPSNLQILVS